MGQSNILQLIKCLNSEEESTRSTAATLLADLVNLLVVSKQSNREVLREDLDRYALGFFKDSEIHWTILDEIAEMLTVDTSSSEVTALGERAWILGKIPTEAALEALVSLLPTSKNDGNFSGIGGAMVVRQFLVAFDNLIVLNKLAVDGELRDTVKDFLSYSIGVLSEHQLVETVRSALSIDK